jgi:hypothetical protein
MDTQERFNREIGRKMREGGQDFGIDAPVRQRAAELKRIEE